jgi:hypothetical protein
MSHDPFAGQFLLTYALADAPGTEFEEWVDDLVDARRHLRGKTDMLEWAELYSPAGDLICDKEVLT